MELEQLIGKKIIGLFTNAQHDELAFITQDKDYVFEAYGDCCSISWFEHISGIEYLLNHTVQQIEEIPMPDVPNPSEDEVIETYGYQIKTEAGHFLIEMRNSSNGYYGGYIEYKKGKLAPSECVEVDF